MGEGRQLNFYVDRTNFSCLWATIILYYYQLSVIYRIWRRSKAIYFLARAAFTKYHNLSGLKSRNLLYCRSGGWKSTIEVLVGLLPFEGCGSSVPSSRLPFCSSLSIFSIPQPARHCLYLCLLHMTFPLCASVSNFPIFIGNANHIQLGTILLQYNVIINYICNDPISKPVHILRYWELQLQSRKCIVFP